MINLVGTSDILRVVTGNAVATDVIASWVDVTTTAYTPGRTLTAITTATTTTIVPAPAASTQRALKTLTICARGGAQTIVLQYFDGATAFQFVGGTVFNLAQGETLQYTDEDGFVILQAAGPGAGRLLGIQYINAGTTSITHVTGSTTTVVEGVGGGGAGGGANAAVAGAMGGCGGSGTWGRKRQTLVGLSSTCVVGTGGVGTATAGGAGVNTTFTHNGITMTLPGGLGGGTVAGAATIGIALGAVATTGATNADISITGQGGGDALRINSSTTGCLHTGNAGSNPLGQGGSGNVIGNSTVVTGNSGTGFGSGSSGALNGTTTTATNGPNGRPGILIVMDYS